MSTGKAPSISQTKLKPSYPGFQSAMTQMGDLAAQDVGKLGEKYPGQTVAGWSPIQERAQNMLGQYAAGTYQPGAYNPNDITQPYTNNPLFQAGANELQKMVSGQYLTADSPYNQAMNKYMYGQQLPQAQSALNQALAVHGGMVGSGAQQQSENLYNQVAQYMAQLGGQQYNVERQNQINAISPAMQTALAEQQAPMQTIESLMALGQPEQDLQQKLLTGAYNEWARQRAEIMSPLSLAPNASQIYPQYQYQYDPGKPNQFLQAGQIMSSIFMPMSGVSNAIGSVGQQSKTAEGSMPQNSSSPTTGGFDWTGGWGGFGGGSTGGTGAGGGY